MSTKLETRRNEVLQLRGLLRERFPEAHRSVPTTATKAVATTARALATTTSPPVSSFDTPASPSDSTPRFQPENPLGVSLLDELDEGRGLPPGACVEVVGRRAGSGGGALIAALIQASAVAENSRPLALIDGADSFDPTLMSDAPGAAAALCQRLLWIRCRHRIDHAFKVADLLLRDGNLPLILLDLQLCRPHEVRRGIPGGPNAWYRLRSLAETTGTVFLSFTGEPLMPAAPWRIELDQTWPIEAIDHLPLTGDRLREPLRNQLTRSRPQSYEDNREEAPLLAAAS